MCLTRSISSSYITIINLGDESIKGDKMCIAGYRGYLRLLEDYYTPIYDDQKDVISDGKWHFVCVSYDKTKISLYYDNEKIFTTNKTFTTVNNPKLTIGAWCVSGLDVFIGDISDVRVYNRGLNADEINTIYQEIKK